MYPSEGQLDVWHNASKLKFEVTGDIRRCRMYDFYVRHMYEPFGFIVGRSCHNEPEARKAEKEFTKCPDPGQMCPQSQEDAL